MCTINGVFGFVDSQYHAPVRLIVLTMELLRLVSAKVVILRKSFLPLSYSFEPLDIVSFSPYFLVTDYQDLTCFYCPFLEHRNPVDTGV